MRNWIIIYKAKSSTEIKRYYPWKYNFEMAVFVPLFLFEKWILLKKEKKKRENLWTHLLCLMSLSMFIQVSYLSIFSIGIKRFGSIRSRKISSQSIRSDDKLEEEMEDGDSPHASSDHETQENYMDQEVTDERNLGQNLPWIKVSILNFNSTFHRIKCL